MGAGIARSGPRNEFGRRDLGNPESISSGNGTASPSWSRFIQGDIPCAGVPWGYPPLADIVMEKRGLILVVGPPDREINHDRLDD